MRLITGGDPNRLPSPCLGQPRHTTATLPGTRYRWIGGQPTVPRAMTNLVSRCPLIIAMAILTIVCNFAAAQDRGAWQHWENEYSACELLEDCNRRGAERCLFFIRSVAQASFWFDKYIPTETSLGEILDITLMFVKQNPQYADSVATNVLLTAIHQKWKCR
jgi:hypothetical protein